MEHPFLTRHNHAYGFTLLEVLVAVSILVVVVGIVYASFAAVGNATEISRTRAEELRTEQFLARNFATNLSTVYADIMLQNDTFSFRGGGEKGMGKDDWMEFCTSAPMVGTSSLPGVTKRVSYTLETSSDSGMVLGSTGIDAAKDEDSRSPLLLQVNETPVYQAATLPLDQTQLPDEDSLLAGFSSPTWSVPITGADFSFFDGKEWVDEWDSVSMGRLPWAVRIRVNFAHAGEEQNTSTPSADAEADMELVIPVPLGEGYYSTGDVWQTLQYGPDAMSQGTQPNPNGKTSTGTTGQTSGNSNQNGNSLPSNYDGRPSQAGGTL